MSTLKVAESLKLFSAYCWYLIWGLLTNFSALNSMHFFYCVGQYDMLPHPQWQTSKYWNVSKSERDFYLDKYLLFPWTVDFLIYIKVAFTIFSYLFDRNNLHILKIGKFCPKTSNSEFVLNLKGKISGLRYLILQQYIGDQFEN